jgi:pimeloyl-ACP methyl ester carboxylesterase
MKFSSIVLVGLLVVSSARLPPQAQTAAHRSVPIRSGPDMLYTAPATSPQLENTGVWKAAPILVSGTSAYRSGEFLYQDYLYDDRGAASRAVYPEPREKYADNAADLVEVRLKPLADELAVRLTLNTMIDPSLVGAVIAFGDTTPAAALPFGAGGRIPATLFVTVHGSSGTITDAATGQTVRGDVRVAVDLKRRQLDVRLPYSAFDPRNKTAVRVAAGVGLWDTATNAFMAPAQPAATASARAGVPPDGNAAAGAAGRAAPQGRGAPRGGGRGAAAPLDPNRSLLFNMAFRFHEPPNADSTLAFYNDLAQAAALGSGDLSPFFASVDFVKLASGKDDGSQIPKTGPMSRILVSHFEPAQGRGTASRLGARCAATPCIPEFAGRLQPYGIYVPAKSPPATGYGLTLDLHSASANYGRWLGQQRYVELGERGTGSIVVTPNGRGLTSWYYSEGAADIFEVWADVERRYKIDRDYVSLAGVSMGAIETFRLAALYPDLFAALAVSVGCPSFMFEAHRYIPAFVHTGDIDTTTNCHPGNELMDAYAVSGQQHVWWNFLEHPHAFSSRPREWQPFADFLGARKRVVDPPHVTYYVNTEADQPEFGMNADHAYWVSGLTVRDPHYQGKVSQSVKTDGSSAWAPYGRIDVVSHGRGRGEPEPNAVVKTSGTFSFGVDYPWPRYNGQEVTWKPPTTAPVRNVLDIVAENIATVTIDPARAKVTCAATINLISDGPTIVTMTGCPRVNVVPRAGRE